MQLPGPVRAVVGLLANAADEAKHLPDRAIELPMLAVSSALQMSMRAQQRYARLTARGDDVIHRRTPTDDPPPWATFDDPVPANGRPVPGLDDPDPALRTRAASQLLDDLLAAGERFAPPDRDPAGDAEEPASGPAVGSATPPTDDLAAKRAANQRRPAKAAATKSTPAETAPAKTAPAKTTPAKTTPAKTTPAKTTSSKAGQPKTGPTKRAPVKALRDAKSSPAKASPAKSKTAKPAGKPSTPAAAPAETPSSAKKINKPRHTAPSRFDTVGDA